MSSPPRTRRLTPAALIIATSVAVAAIILGITVRDSTPPPLPADRGQLVFTPGDPASPSPTTP